MPAVPGQGRVGEGVEVISAQKREMDGYGGVRGVDCEGRQRGGGQTGIRYQDQLRRVRPDREHPQLAHVRLGLEVVGTCREQRRGGY